MKQMAIWWSAVLIAVLFATAPGRPSAAAAASGHWAAAWAAAPQPASAATRAAVAEVTNQTLRQTVRLALGGDRIQVRLSNEYGTRPLRIGAASISVNGTVRALTFGGAASATIPAGAPALSDPVDVAAPRMAEASVSLYLPERTAVETVHILGLHPTLVSAPGDFTGATDFPVAARSEFRAFLSGVSVWTTRPTRVVAAFGASIVDGFRSTPGAYADWPDVLAGRLAKRPGTAIGVVNLGIAGNRVVTDGTGASALARFDRDVLSQPGVTHVILLEGRNDLAALPGPRTGPGTPGSDADAVFAGYRQIVERAHQRGIKVIGTPVTPDSTDGWDEHKEAERRKLNALVRTSRLFDGYVDLDSLLQNPAGPGLLPAYDSGDHLHPSDAGYRVMGDAFDLTLFD